MDSLKKGDIIVLAFDIERSGGRTCDDTIAIGASVVGPDLTELDSLFLPGYFGKDQTHWEEACWEEFWSEHLVTLTLLVYNGDLTKAERQREMIKRFQLFRSKWERIAQDKGCKLELVSDNNVFDGGFINQMINEHYPDALPIPYTSNVGIHGNKSQNYKRFWETHSEQRGLLMAIDPEYKKGGGYARRIEELYQIPPSSRLHDHDPSNDAYTIAREQQILLGIRDGRFSRGGLPISITIRCSRITFSVSCGLAVGLLCGGIAYFVTE